MLIGAYAYPWYTHGWLCRTARAGDPPTLGEYDNAHHGDAIGQCMALARRAGIDFLSLSWDGSQDHGHVLDAARAHGMPITYFYESLVHGKDGRLSPHALPLMLKDLDRTKELMQEPCWLRVDNRPVLMIYVVRAWQDAPAMLDAIRRLFPDAFIVGDVLWWDPLCSETLRRLDAATAYNWYQDGHKRFLRGAPYETATTYLASVRAQMAKHIDVCKSVGVPIWGNAMPGYNDSGVRPDRGHYPIPRLGGDFFRMSLEDAKAAGDCVMVTSLDEWYEDTQILPCLSYGNMYLDILRKFKDAHPAAKLPWRAGI